MPTDNANSSRSLFGKLMWLIFRCPGVVILWIRYHFPGQGQVYVSARQRGVPIIEVMFSLGFWLVAGFIGNGMVRNALKDDPAPTASVQPSVQQSPPVYRPQATTQPAAPSQAVRPTVPPAAPSQPVQPSVPPASSRQTLPPQMASQLVKLISEQVYACWNVPAEVLNFRNPPIPKIELTLNRDGSLQQPPRLINQQSGDPLFGILANSALQAVRRCTPLRIPGQYAGYYEDWSKVVINFNATE